MISATGPFGLDRAAIAAGDRSECLDHAGGRRGDGRVPADTSFAHVPPHRARGALALGVEPPVEIGRAVIVPARFGMPKEEQGLHAAFRVQGVAGACTTGMAEESRDRTRATASSSGTRAIGTPGGKAASNRLGIAADSRTNAPRSSARRINRPNAWASLARTMRSSYALPPPASRRAAWSTVGLAQGTPSRMTWRKLSPGTLVDMFR